ncbi:MAG TPA: response regulator [Terriglobia bacterium]|nr:response regulator [Terriglobia bacterium]
MTSVVVLFSSYDPVLVALSVLIAIFASYAALDLAGRVTSAYGRARFVWLSGGAIAMGIGIWSMHYIGMLAFRLPIPVQYDWPTVLLSLLAAIFASAVALFVVSRRTMGVFRASVGSVFMGGGIAAMHYIGMAAMRLPAMCHYSVTLVSLSVVLAIVISFVAMLLTFHFRRDTTSWGWQKAVSALVMGAAIPVMHYTGMAAASFTPSTVPQDISSAVSISSLGVAGITVVTFMVLGLVLLTSLADRRFSVQASELESSEQSYRRIIEAALDAFVGMDSNGLIMDWNPQAEGIFGWSSLEAIGQDLAQTIIPDRYRNAHRKGLRQFLASGEGRMLNRRTEVTGLHRDGHEFPIELTISAIRRGDSHRFAAFIRDVTDQKRIEHEREKAKEAAEAANRAKSEFLANMSHEIRTPLNGVLGMTDLALETELTAEQREYLETVKLSADSLLSVINDILDFSKIEAGKVDFDLDDFNLRDTLEATLKTVALRADEKGLELLCEMAPDVPEMLRGDCSRLRQVVLNLVGNAIKFTDEGEVALSVQVQSRNDDNLILQFTVSDTGIGIPLEKQKLIFQPFSQADTSTTRKYGGTGLGLTISIRLVEMMGGTMWVESEVGAGSRFHFTAPLERSKRQIETATIARPEILRNVKVLVVDDNRTNRRILEGMLNRWHMDVTAADDVEEALEQLSSARNKEEPYALILADMHLPNVDGFAFIERIRQRAELTSAIIMMLTSAGHLGDAERCRKLGVAAYLLKPIRQSELREAIAQALGAKSEDSSTPLVTRNSLQETSESPTLLSVLVAEDNPVNQRLTTRLLEKRGHRVVLTTNGREALEALEKDSFDLVLMDVQMPEMDGFEATAALREREKKEGAGTHQPVIALTAHAMKGDEERCLAAGMDGYLAKPIQPQQLDSLLQSYMARRMEAVNTRDGTMNAG